LSLRFRLFLLFGGLVALLGGAELWLVRTLTRDLSVELERVATTVGRDVIRFMGRIDVPAGKPGEGASATKVGGDAVTWTRTHETLPAPGSAGHPLVITSGAPDAGEKLEGVTTEGGGEGQPVVKTVREGRTETVTAPDGTPVTRHVYSELRVTASGKAGAPRVIVLQAPGGPFHTFAIPQAGVEEAVGRFRDRLLLGSLGILGAGLLGAAVVAVRVAAPLRRLASAARQVGDGAFGSQVEGAGSGEVGEAIQAFNRMSSRLGHLEQEALAGKEREHLSELGEVGRGLAHALRNPLHAVGLTLDQLAALARDEARAEELAESARRQIRHVDDSIRAFLALASGGAGSEEPVDVRALAADVALTALHDARGRVRLSVMPGGGEGPFVRGVPAELKAAVQALVVNAIEASPDGGLVEVHVRGAAPDVSSFAASIDILDEGPGLPREVREKLFTPHVTTKPAGSGMGLFLAHRLATSRYGGSLTVKDREGARGTVAVLTLRDRVASGDGSRSGNA